MLQKAMAGIACGKESCRPNIEKPVFEILKILLHETNILSLQLRHFHPEQWRSNRVDVTLYEKKFNDVSVASTERIMHVASAA